MKVIAIRIPRITQARKILKRTLSNGGTSQTSMEIPKGYFSIYVGEQDKKRFIVSVSLLREPLFLYLLHQAQEEFGNNHPLGGLTIPCNEDEISELASCLGVF